MTDTWFTTKQLEKDIWGIGEFGHFEEVISYLVVGDKSSLLFDTGIGIGDIQSEVHSITKLPLMVINSHSHYDHIGGNRQFTSIYLYDCDFSKQRADAGYSSQELTDITTHRSFFQKPPASFQKDVFTIPPFQYEPVADGDIFECEPFSFEVIHTPGHSPDSICLFEKNLGILFSGDTLYDGPIYLQLKESNIYEYKKSLHKLLKVPIKTIYGAHNEFTVDQKNIPSIIQALDKPLANEISITDQVKLLLRPDGI